MDSPRRICVLVTDFGQKGSHYVATMKAQLLKRVDPQVSLSIVDGTHEVTPFNVNEGQFLLEYLVPEFPPRTIFLVVVDPGVGGSRDILIARTKSDRFLVGPDNGIFTGVLQQEGLDQLYRVSSPKEKDENVSATFHGRDIMAPLAAQVLNGTPLGELGAVTADYHRIEFPSPEKMGSGKMKTVIRYVDQFGNAVTNLHPSPSFLPEWTRTNAISLTRLGQTRPFLVIPACRTYGEVDPGQPLALVGSFGNLELSINQGNFASKYAIAPQDVIILELTLETETIDNKEAYV